MKYRMNIAGLDRDLPLCKVSDDLYIGAFVMFGDAEITVACAKELLARRRTMIICSRLRPRASPSSTRWPASPARRNISSPARV